MNELAMNLKAANLKVTPQRLAIYTYLADSKEHPSVETIYNDLRADYPAMSLATVYKTVATLRDAHLLLEFNVGEDSHRYDANTSFHPHLICTHCHNVYDYFTTISLKKTRNEITQATGFEVQNQEINFYGVCSKCKSEM